MLRVLTAALVAATAPSEADEAAIMTAAGFSMQGAQWTSGRCEGMEGESYMPGSVDLVRDLNGDGRPEAIVTESSGICYGNTGTAFWLLTRQTDGRWRMIHSEIGIPDFLPTRGRDGWPDLMIGGPGFCFEVRRWDGAGYRQQRYEYDGKPCIPGG